MHEGKEIEIRVDRKSFRNWKSPLQWIWNDDSDCFTSLNSFLVTEISESMSNTLFQFIKINESIHIHKHSRKKRNRNKGW